MGQSHRERGDGAVHRLSRADEFMIAIDAARPALRSLSGKRGAELCSPFCQVRDEAIGAAEWVHYIDNGWLEPRSGYLCYREMER